MRQNLYNIKGKTLIVSFIASLNYSFPHGSLWLFLLCSGLLKDILTYWPHIVRECYLTQLIYILLNYANIICIFLSALRKYLPAQVAMGDRYTDSPQLGQVAPIVGSRKIMPIFIISLNTTMRNVCTSIKAAIPGSTSSKVAVQICMTCRNLISQFLFPPQPETITD